MDIPESDWRRFREVRARLLERYCVGVLKEIAAAVQTNTASAHDRYLKVYKLVEQRDKQLGDAFNDFRRSTVIIQLAMMRRMGLLTNEELSSFSEPTRRRVEAILSL